VSSLVYDAGALVAAESGTERMWAIHKRALARDAEPVVPAPVLTEVWRGGRGQHRLGEFLKSCDVEGFTEGVARAAGLLLATAPHGVVDASVVECALRRRAPCVTGNRAHLVELAGDRRIDIIDV
jgi:hypothetical protein